MLNNVLGKPAAAPFYIWANSDCANKTEDFEEAKRIRKSLVGEGAEDVYISDAEGVEVVDAEIEAEEKQASFAATAAKHAGQALEAAYPWGYRSTESSP